MSDPIHDLSQGTQGLTPQQRLDTMLAHLGRQPGPTMAEEDAAQSEDAPPTRGELTASLSRINEAMRPYRISFDINSYENRTVAMIIDRNTGEVIRQIPREEVLRIAESLSEMQGRLIDLKA